MKGRARAWRARRHRQTRGRWRVSGRSRARATRRRARRGQRRCARLRRSFVVHDVAENDDGLRRLEVRYELHEVPRSMSFRSGERGGALMHAAFARARARGARWRDDDAARLGKAVEPSELGFSPSRSSPVAREEAGQPQGLDLIAARAELAHWLHSEHEPATTCPHAMREVGRNSSGVRCLRFRQHGRADLKPE
jgi:hypothetical protein